MTITPLPSLPVDLVVPAAGVSGAASGASGASGQEATADSFAALVLAVLDAGARPGEDSADPATAGSPADATPVPAGRHADGTSSDAARMTSDATVPGRHADGTSSDAARMTSPLAVGTTLPVSTADAASAGAGIATSETNPAAGSEPVDADSPGVQLGGESPYAAGAIVPLPVSLPAALAAALGLGPVVPAPSAADRPAPTTPSGPSVATASSAPTVSGSGELSTVPTTASVDHAPPAATALASGELSTVPTTQTVDHAPPTTTAPGSGELSTVPTTASVDHAPLTGELPAATAGRHADGTSIDASRMTSAPTATRPDQAQTTQVQATQAPAPQAQAPQAQATRSSEPSITTDPINGTDAPAPTFVQAGTGSEATTRTADTAPSTTLTRSTAAQVVPELTRLVQAGPGTHRMVLRLDPEHLGDVRITLTMGPDGVRVRMAAGSEDARAALADGLPALHRALETAAGRPAGETHIAVLNQPTQGQTQGQGQQATTYDGSAPSTQTGDTPDHQTPADRQTAGDREAGRPARTQVDTTARDGSQDGGTGRAPRPADPLTSSRTARLDVSM